MRSRQLSVGPYAGCFDCWHGSTLEWQARGQCNQFEASQISHLAAIKTVQVLRDSVWFQQIHLGVSPVLGLS